MTDERPRAAPAVNSGQEVDRIREIIFGTQMRDYGQRFEAIQQEIDRLRQEIARLSERQSEQRDGLSVRLDELRVDVQQTADDLRSELEQVAERLEAQKVDRETLGQWLIGLGTSLKSGKAPPAVLEPMDESETE
jgi:chromosome segregation ATPase